MATAKRKIEVDLSYYNAATILARIPDRMPLTIALVGCGGTGSYLAQHIGRLLFALKEKGTPARGIFVDHDRVEEKNLGRQLFCRAELGLNKAETLALRYGSAWGLDIKAIAKRFTAKLDDVRDTDHKFPHNSGLTVYVGCVDNAAARKELALSLMNNGTVWGPPTAWWLDCGNSEDSGQVLLGSELDQKRLARAFPSREICQALPAPSLQRPELLIARPEELKSTRLSCAELTMANVQSLNINSRIAAEAADFLTRLLLTRNLKRYAVELNLAAGSMKSTYATPEAVGVSVTKKEARRK